MEKFERYLKDILFVEKETTSKVIYQREDAEKHWVLKKYQSKLGIGIVTVAYSMTYVKLKKLIDIEYIQFETKYEHVTFPSIKSFENRIESNYNIEKMINIFKQKQIIVFAKETIKFALKEIKISIKDYLIAKSKIIKLRLGGKQ